MSEQTGPVLHRAEERGQSRELKTEEVGATAKMSLVETGALAILAFTCVLVFGALVGRAVDLGTVATALLTALAIAALAFYINVTRNFAELREGQCSYRQIESYAQPSPQPAQPSWRPPVPVIRQGQPAALLDLNERPALPSPQEARQITPPVVAELLKASLEVYNGEWSRRKLMRLRIAGQRVSRGMYEEITGALYHAGILQQTRGGGFVLNVESFDDLRALLPSLPAPGGMGGRPGRDGNGGGQDDPPPGREVGTLAERRKNRWLECDCDVRLYLERRGNHD